MRPVLLPLALVLACQSNVYGLQNSDVPTDTPVSALISSAKEHLAKGSARDALPFFDAAISRDPTNYLTIFQRGATFLSLGRDSQATSDFDRVLELKPDFEGALLQRARIRTRAADWAAAKRDLEAAGKRNTQEYEELEEARAASVVAEEAEKRGDWETCANQAGIAIMKASTALSLRQVRARCRFERGEIQEAISDLGHVLQLSPSSLGPHLQISNMLFYSLGDTDRGVAQVRKCLHSDPDSKQCSRLFRRQKNLTKRLEKLLDLMDKKKYTNAAGVLTGSGEDSGLIEDVKEDVAEARKEGYIHPKAPENLYVFLIESACEAYRNANMPKRARLYCLESLEHNDRSLHGLLFQAQTFIDEENYERAVHILNQAKDYHPSAPDVQNLLRQAQVLLKRSKQKDYYKVLGVGRDADERTIKRAYRSLTKIHHPDKAASQGVTKEEAEKKMASINEAYEVLSDPELKARYDSGDDPNDPESQRGGHPFQGHPFGGAFGGQQFFFQQGGGQQFKFQGSPFG